ncbi:MAG TPA: class I SAM-dependent methyltransferase [Gaiellaceae bacterium]|nr:class I SAM-dependent methyltransferase [Gaiellaceae bacterium]
MGAPRALSFGRAAEHYERGRPVWPVAAVDAVGLPRDSHVLDLAAGTGKLTRVLVERFDRVTAVEPDDAMRALNRWGDVRAGSADAIPLADGDVDGVFVADAFHWFAEAPAVREIVRVLRRGGTLALLWNRGERDWSPPLPEVDPVWERLQASDEPHPLAGGEWRSAVEVPELGPLAEAHVEEPYRVDRERLIAYLLSQSTVAMRPAEEVEAIAAELAAAVPDGDYELPLRAEVFTARRL